MAWRLSAGVAADVLRTLDTADAMEQSDQSHAEEDCAALAFVVSLLLRLADLIY
jgi:hypothetical protein